MSMEAMRDLRAERRMQAEQWLAGSQGRRSALGIAVCSVLVGITGNMLLGFLGLMTALLVLINGARAAGPVAPLGLITGILAMFQLALVLFGVVMVLASTPQGFCARSTALLEYTVGPATPKPPPYQVGYPWNMTSSVRGAAEKPIAAPQK